MDFSPSEWKIAMAGTALVLLFVLWRWFLRWIGKPVTPDPWGPEIAAALEAPDATPICAHCQTPHQMTDWFCPRCGRSVGDFTNLLAPFYAYSIGEVLRDGINNSSKLGPFRCFGSVVIAACAYLIVAPFFLDKALLWVWAFLEVPVVAIVWPAGVAMFAVYLSKMFGTTKSASPEIFA